MDCCLQCFRDAISCAIMYKNNPTDFTDLIMKELEVYSAVKFVSLMSFANYKPTTVCTVTVSKGHEVVWCGFYAVITRHCREGIMFLGCPVGTFIHLSCQMLLPRCLVNGLNRFDRENIRKLILINLLDSRGQRSRSQHAFEVKSCVPMSRVLLEQFPWNLLNASLYWWHS